jgi:hypothetical protein
MNKVLIAACLFFWAVVPVCAGVTNCDDDANGMMDHDCGGTNSSTPMLPYGMTPQATEPTTTIAGRFYVANNNVGGWDPCTVDGTDDYLCMCTAAGPGGTYVAIQNIVTGAAIFSGIDETVPILDGDDTGSILWSFATSAQRTITIPGDQNDTIAVLGQTNAWTGSNDFGGAAGLELPNGANPTVDAAGEVAIDTDGANETSDLSLRAFDGTNTVALGRKLHCIQATIIKPQDLADSERDLFPIWANNTGMVFTITEIKAYSDTDDTTVTVEVVTDTNWSSPATVDALEIATNGTSVFTDVQTTITDSTIAHDEIITLDFDDTDDPGMVKITICGWFNAAVD